jgi:type II secretory pathway component PulK
MRPAGRERGVALIIVLWVFMILGVLALDFGRYVRDDAMAAVNFAEETQGYYVALAGMNRTLFAYSHEKDTDEVANKDADPDEIGLEDLRVEPDSEWHEQTFATAHYEVKLTDESGLIPINAGNVENPIDSSFLQALLKHVITYLMQGGNRTTGMNVQDTKRIDTIVDSILDWRDKGSEARASGAEHECKLDRDRSYRAPNRPFESREELLEVCGMTPELFYGDATMPGLRDLVSIWRARKEDPMTINPLKAPAEVIQVLTDLDAAGAAELVAERDAEKDLFAEVFPTKLSAELQQFAERISPKGDTRVVFIEARADTRVERNRSHIAAIVDLHSDQGAEIVQPMAWFDRAPWTEPIARPHDPRQGEGK